MEFIEPLWTFADGWKLRLLVIIVVAQMVLAIRLYTVMAEKRRRAVLKEGLDPEVYRATVNEPENLAVFNRAVVNQFELPVLFYALIAISLALGVSSWLTVILAALFVGFRWTHASEMIGEHVILRRRKKFIRGFQVLIALMAEVVISTLLRA